MRLGCASELASAAVSAKQVRPGDLAAREYTGGGAGAVGNSYSTVGQGAGGVDGTPVPLQAPGVFTGG